MKKLKKIVLKIPLGPDPAFDFFNLFEKILTTHNDKFDDDV